MSLKENLRSDLTTAMKSGEKVAVAAIRMALAAVTNAEVAGKSARSLSDDEIVAVISKEVKKREEAAEAFRAGSREASALEEEAQADILRKYLPEPLSGGALQELIDGAVATATAEGLSGGRAMGRVMALLKEPTAGRVDVAAVAVAVKRALGMG